MKGVEEIKRGKRRVGAEWKKGKGGGGRGERLIREECRRAGLGRRRLMGRKGIEG